ncbi:MAG TPA: hypothetical protein VFL97_01900, partial [Nitrococcus sp.]|nr:hypothetical protein [Nitrococcus sp.]
MPEGDVKKLGPGRKADPQDRMSKVGMSARHSLRDTVRRLLLGRALRTVGQGILTTDFALYLHALGWSSTAIGSLLTAVLTFSVALTAMAGVL